MRKGRFGLPRIRQRGPLIEDDFSDDSDSNEEIQIFRWQNEVPKSFTDSEVEALMQIESNMLRGYVTSVAERLEEEEPGGITLERVLWSKTVENYAREIDELPSLEKARDSLQD
jgi:hypothetical protein